MIWPEVMDPSDIGDRVMDFGVAARGSQAAALEDGETLSSASVTVDDAAAAAGVSIDAITIDADAAGRPGRAVRFRPIVDPAQQDAAVFEAGGLTVRITVRADIDPGGQRIERSADLIIRQR